MDQDMITDITLDHLPDLSEASVSFQIPSNNSASADLLLLADQTDGFDLLRNVLDDDTSFAPATFLKPRGQPLTLGELTPRVQTTSRSMARSPSPTPIRVPCSSTKPSVISHRIALGHRSPNKSRQTPSPAKFIHRIETPCFSEERLDRLRTDVETLGQAEVESPTHVHAIQITQDGPPECESPSCAKSSSTDDVLPVPTPVSEALDQVSEEKDAYSTIGVSVDQDVIMGPETEGHTDTMDAAVPLPRAKSKRDPRTSAKSVVTAGGSSKPSIFPATHVSKKTKKKPSRIREAPPTLPAAARQITPTQSITINAELQVPSACMSGNINLNPDNTQTNGIAERLVFYSQNVISSFGLSKPKSERYIPEISNDVVRVENGCSGPLPPAAAQPPPLPPRRTKDNSRAHDEPLRVSEISPHKPPDSPAHSGSLQDGRQHAMSPLRPAKKRVSKDSDRLLEHHRRKRGKMMSVEVDLERGSSEEAISQGHIVPRLEQANQEDHMATHSKARDDARHSDSLKSALPSARTKYRPKLDFSSGCKGPTLDPFPYLSKSHRAHLAINKGKGQRNETQCKTARIRSGSLLNRRSARARLRREGSSGEANTVEPSYGRQQSGPTSTVADLPLIKKKQDATSSVAALTKPVGFTFRVDARLEARKTEERLAASEPAKVLPHHGIVDSKLFRASHQVGMGTGKMMRVVPSAPAVPFFFCTEQRAKEREKFDEMVKRKEEEMQKLKEEERRREAEEEERAIRELRRKAIPKANEVPEWYADMPKKKGRRCATEWDRENTED